MTSKNQNIDDHTSGDTLIIEVEVSNTDGTAKDITSASIEWVLAKRRGGTAVISKSAAGGGISITDAVAGLFEVTIDPADTDSLAGLYFHEAEVTDSAGNISTVLEGHVFINDDTA